MDIQHLLHFHNSNKFIKILVPSNEISNHVFGAVHYFLFIKIFAIVCSSVTEWHPIEDDIGRFRLKRFCFATWQEMMIITSKILLPWRLNRTTGNWWRNSMCKIPAIVVRHFRRWRCNRPWTIRFCPISNWIN